MGNNYRHVVEVKETEDEQRKLFYQFQFSEFST